MDVIKSANINVQNSLIISGSPNAESDKELFEHLKQHGSIKRFLSINAPNTKFHEHVVVEYTEYTAIQSLKPLLPSTFEHEGEEGVCYHLRALVDVYAPEVSDNTTKTYLEQLMAIAQATGKTLEELLATEISKLSTACAATASETADITPAIEPTQKEIRKVHVPAASGTPPSASQSTKPPQTMDHNAPVHSFVHPAVSPPNFTQTAHSVTANLDFAPRAEAHVMTGEQSSSNFNINNVNPPEVQRLVVEHIVRNADVSSSVHTSNRLRSFSGKSPHSNSEVDYDTWRANVELILKDPAISDLHRVRKILESLLSPAADVVKQLGPQASPTDYLQLLDSAFGTVDDGEELFAKFMNTLQDAGEKPSHYLNRLQVILSQAVKRGGVASTEQGDQLLRQFRRGCWDSTMLSSLQLEQRKSTPPSFPEFLLLLRTEEDRQAAKAVRMRQHLGVPKQRAATHLQCACTHEKEESTASEENQALDTLCDTQNLKREVAGLQSQIASLKTQNRQTSRHQTNPSQLDPLVHDLKRQIAELQSQMAALKLQIHSPSFRTEADMQVSTTARMQNGRPRPWYCFRCGQDGHIAPNCTETPDQAMVAEKKKQLREKQLMWEAQNSSSRTQSLN